MKILDLKHLIKETILKEKAGSEVEDFIEPQDIRQFLELVDKIISKVENNKENDLFEASNVKQFLIAEIENR